MIPKKRIQILNSSKSKKKEFGIYWMQRAQRAQYNHALEFAVRKANKKIPLIVLFFIFEDYPHSNKNHFRFMFEGLKETKKTLKHKGINFILLKGNDKKKIFDIFSRTSFLVLDKGYLNYEKKIRQKILKDINLYTVEIETNIVVPVEAASSKEEYAANTMRKKINSQLGNFLKPLNETKLQKDSLDYSFDSIKMEDIENLLKNLDLNNEIQQQYHFKGGFSEAKKRLNEFISNKLPKYDELSNYPEKKYISNMSPYLHFGQISPLYIVKMVNKKSSDNKNKESFFEQLIIRRELSFNFVYYNANYNNIKSLSDWAYKTLMEHKNDKRDYLYEVKDFEASNTHDKYWNAAQKEMMITGKMANYMRMYWGKKILEWTESPQKAFDIALKLNNKYHLDGRDPNSYAGIAWCFGKHDRVWKERKIYGKVRYMSKKGLERKFNIDKYVQKVNNLKS